jgi:hypothetical protein
MTDHYDHDDDEAFERRVRTEGPRTAYRTALEICDNPKAPAPAKATALTALFRVSGWFNKKEEPEVDALSGMTATGLAALRRKFERDLAEIEAKTKTEGAAADSDGGVFD